MTNPALIYQFIGAIDGRSKLYKARRHADGKIFAVSYLPAESVVEKDFMLNEFRIYSALKIDKILRC